MAGEINGLTVFRSCGNAKMESDMEIQRMYRALQEPCQADKPTSIHQHCKEVAKFIHL